jgi:uncharacterized membrane protein YqjE
MADPPDDSVAKAGPVREALATALEAVATRLELAAVELDEQRAEWARQAAYAVAVLFCAVLAVALLVALVVFAAPAEQRVWVLVALLAAAAAGAGACAWRLRALDRRRPPLLGATLDVLRADAAALRPPRGD